MVKHAETIRRFLPMICLSLFDHFVGLPLKGLITIGNGNGHKDFEDTKTHAFRITLNLDSYFSLENLAFRSSRKSHSID